MTKARRGIPRGNTDKVLRRAYAEQLDMIGRILIRAKLLTRRDVHRDGVAFAVRNRFEPPARPHRKIAASGR
jgi:hypothetical protein